METTYGRGSLVAILLSMVLSTAAPLAGQTPRVALELRAGRSIPTGSFASGRRSPSAAGHASFGVHLRYRLAAGPALRLGFSQHRYDTGPDTEGASERWVSTGWDFGVRLMKSVGPIEPALHLGVILQHVETAAAVSGTTLGGEAGVSLALPLGSRFHLDPGVRYVVYDADLAGPDPVQIRHLVVDLGLLIGF
jgi:hypothetical protein